MSNLKTGIVAFLILLSNATSACDICGCSSIGMSGALFPQIQNNLLGLRYAPLTLTHPNSFNGPNNPVFRDVYYDSEIFFRWNPAKRLQLWFNVPFRVHVREEAIRKTLLQGIGDIQVNAFYSLIRTPDSVHRNYRHLLMAGGGFGMPTGKYQQKDETLTTLPVNFQIGSGAWSARATMLYLIRHNRIGAQIQGDFQLFSSNENDFRKGDQVSGQLQVFYRFPLKNSLLLPQLGVREEYLQKDNEFGQRKLDSGGRSTWGVFNVDWFTRNFMIGGIIQIPIQVQLNGNQPTSEFRFGLTAGIIW